MPEEVFIIEALRTPVGDVNGSLKDVSAPLLGAELIKELLKRYPGLSGHIDSVMLGNNVSAGVGQNPARQTALHGGLPAEINSFTLNQVCGSGLTGTCLAYQLIKNQELHTAITGGMESTSNMPYLIDRGVNKKNLSPEILIDSLQNDGLTCAFKKAPMGQAAEYLAETLAISREEQDQFALESQMKAVQAIKEKKFEAEIVPLNNQETLISQDEKPRENTSFKKLSRLKPVFKENGTITAGNASGLGDAAAIFLLASGKSVKENNLKPLAKIIDTVTVGTKPPETFLGLPLAIGKLLAQNKLTAEDIDLFEICESFACVVVGTLKKLSLPLKKINIYGGDIAFGHPLGASGARILVTLTHALINNRQKRGLAVVSMGGGHTIAVLLETV